VREQVDEVPRFVRHLPPDAAKGGDGDYTDDQCADERQRHVRVASGEVDDRCAEPGVEPPCEHRGHHMDADEHGHRLTEDAMPDEDPIEPIPVLDRQWPGGQRQPSQSRERRRDPGELRQAGGRRTAPLVRFPILRGAATVGAGAGVEDAHDVLGADVAEDRVPVAL
jgi:hypothetical protein